MKLNSFAPWILVSQVGASLVEYNKVCPDLHETKYEINTGEWVLVKCGWAGSHNGKQSQIAGISTPTACAQLCSEVPECTHSSWGANNKCLLSGTKFTEREVKNSVLLVKTSPDDELDECPEDDPYCDDDEICEEELEETINRLQICQENAANCDSLFRQCLAEKEVLLRESVEAPLAESGSSAGGFPKCDDSHGITFTAPNNKSFKIDCRQGGNFTPIKKYNSQTFARCVDECAYRPNCKAAEFVKAGNWQGHCQLYELSRGDSGRWIFKENRASAVLVEE